MAASQEIQRFCRAQGATPKLSSLASLFVEEIAKNTVTHGFGSCAWRSTPVIFRATIRSLRWEACRSR